ncbi:hypothetical protein B0T24DRAFT_82661 [Lasiosphaeria ovina]|uniref:N-acetyltransferase domain-containing protein n=1 Tax=Lasiosphaeria ovina TaxID=92902 RepID=A0AAE0NMV4_9PEZI|nr:hypothetical protein B0T24DRAFT_82661 [Lasiosphaeria ovina]
MTPENEIRSWTRSSDATYLCSTDPKLVQLDALGAALASDMLWWAQPLAEDELRRTVEHSLCFGLYVIGQTTADGGNEDPSSPPLGKTGEMVGFARLITDYATFGWLTDVYVLPEHRGKGLGQWLTRCLDEVVSAWPRLRRCMLVAGNPTTAKMYESALGMNIVCEKGTGSGLFIMEKPGRVAITPKNHH